MADVLFLWPCLLGFFALPAQAESGAYVPYSGIIHGTDGADPVEVSVMNETGGALECRAALAHWYSDDLGRIAPGAELTVTLWHDTETGVLNLMNATDDRMPVEALLVLHRRRPARASTCRLPPARWKRRCASPAAQAVTQN